MSVKFGLSADNHFGYPNVFRIETWPPGEWRNRKDAAARLAAMVITWNAAGVHFNFSNADLFDGTAVGAEYATALAAIQAEFDNLTNKADDLYHSIGHHERIVIRSGHDIFTDMADYWGAVENIYWDADDGQDGEPWAYTFDRNGFRFIVCWTTNRAIGADLVEVDDSGNDQLAWLTARLAETELPVVVFSHDLSNPAGQYCIADNFQRPGR